MSFRKLILAFLMISLGLLGCDKQIDQPDRSIEMSKERENSPKDRDIDKVVSAPIADELTAQAEGNHLPTIKATTLVDPYIHRGVDIEVVADAEDPDFDEITLDYRWFLNGTELTGEKRNILSGDLFSKGDEVSLWITPSDQYGSGKVFYGSKIIIPNAPPEFGEQNEIMMKGDVLSCTVKATDPDNDQLTFALANAPEGMTIDRDKGELFWSRKNNQRGSYQVKITVKDEAGAQSILPLAIGAQVEN